MRRLALVLALVFALPATASAAQWTEVYKTPKANGKVTCHEARHWSYEAIVYGSGHSAAGHTPTSCKRRLTGLARDIRGGKRVTWEVPVSHQDVCNVWSVPKHKRTYVMCRTKALP